MAGDLGGESGDANALDKTVPSEAGGAAPVAAAVLVSVAVDFPAPHWDKYEFVEVLGRGGMGAVYKATDRRLGRPVALKFIHGDDRGMIQRFLQEARAQARLDHPHICKVYEVGTVDGKPYIAMELIAGQTLDRSCARLTLTEKLQLLKDAAEAVHAAHAQGVIHRDLKPSKVTTERNRTSNDPQRFEVLANYGLRSGGSASHPGGLRSRALHARGLYRDANQRPAHTMPTGSEPKPCRDFGVSRSIDALAR